MKTRQTAALAVESDQAPFPGASSIAALRAWYEGISAREAVTRYLGDKKVPGESSRGVLGSIRRELIQVARHRQREDLAALFNHPVAERMRLARAVAQAIDLLRSLQARQPLIDDAVTLWLAPRAIGALHVSSDIRN